MEKHGATKVKESDAMSAEGKSIVDVFFFRNSSPVLLLAVVCITFKSVNYRYTLFLYV